MNSNFKSRASDRLIASLMDRGISVTANIHDAVQVTPTLFKIIATFSTLSAEPHLLQQAVAASLSNDFSVVENSFRRLKSQQQAAVGFIRVNTVSKPYDDTAVASLQLMRGDSKQTAGNLLMDETDQSLWSVQASGDSKYLVRQAPENLSELVQMARVRAFNVPRLGQMALASLQSNDYIAFVHPVTQEIAHGFKVAEDADTIKVLCGVGETVDVNPDLVVESAHLGDAIVQHAVEAKIDLPDQAKSKSDMTSYYEVLYGKAPEFFTELKDIIQRHAAL